MRASASWGGGEMALIQRRRGQRQAGDEQIDASWKISDVLRAYPQLLDVLIDTTPAFGRLRNPALRRVQSRLVTVEQAARIAGIEPDALVARLNGAIGVDSVNAPISANGMSPEHEAVTRPGWLDEAAMALDLDVRPFQERGEEPFGAIMTAARETPVGSMFLLRNTFEPVPLYDVLGMRGFEHWVQRDADDDWRIWFFNSGTPRKPTSKPKAKAPVAPEPAAETWSHPDAVVTIDVSELVPPEPMIKILETLESLPDGASLLVHHLRRPMHLYPQLDAMGYRHDTREIAPDRIEVLIEKPPFDEAAP